MVHLNR